MSAPNVNSNFKFLCEEYDINLIKFIFHSEAIYAVCVLDEEDNADKFIISEAGAIIGSRNPEEIFHKVIGDTSIVVANREEAKTWAIEALELVIEPTDVFDLDSLIIQITNHGLTKESIQCIAYFNQLVNTYRYQIDHEVLGNLLTIPSLKAIQHVYSEYIFWDNIPRSVSFENQLNQINTHQFIVDFTRLSSAFMASFQIVR